MAIINAARTFQGSELGGNEGSRIIKPEVRQISFSDKKYSAGLNLFILPPYKVDGAGNGVWYKVVNVRDNFGVDAMKERFVDTEDSPIAFFAKQVKLKYPAYGEVQKIQKDGQERKVYPSYGRVSKRVLFNVGFMENLGLGAHVIDVPNYGCADQIDRWHRRILPGGGQPPLVCDHTCAVVVSFKLNRDNKGNPWEVIVDGSKSYTLPAEIADSDNLYNLDDVLIIKDKEELIMKLRQVTPVEIFDDCMRGYGHGIGNVVSMSSSNPTKAAAAPVASAPTPVALTANIPPASVAVAPAVANIKIPPASLAPQSQPTAKVETLTDSNPMAGISAAKAAAWLKSQ